MPPSSPAKMRIHASAILYFDAVRRAGSIREAARQLNVASSAVNRQILKLEAEVGAPLFERRPNGVILTAAGELLTRHVIVVLQDLERARSDIEALHGARIGSVAIAAVESANPSLLPNVLRRMRAIAPRVGITTTTLGSRVIPSALADGIADIGIAFGVAKSPRLRQVHVARFRLGAIMAPDHPLAGRKTVTLATCCDYPLIHPGNDLSIADLLTPRFEQIYRPIEPAVVTDSLELTRQLALSPPLIGFQTRIGLEHALKNGELVHVPLLDARGPIWSDLGVYIRAGRSLSSTLDLVLQTLTAELAVRETDEQSSG